MKKINYTLTEEEVIKVERLFHEKSMHEAIITELINTNPNLSVRSLPIYEELFTIRKEYTEYVDSLIKKYTGGKYGSNDKWSIQFREAQLVITATEE